jgi:hypothetical protein
MILVNCFPPFDKYSPFFEKYDKADFLALAPTRPLSPQ